MLQVFKEKAGRQVGLDALVRGWGHGAKKFSRFVLFFVEAIKISSFFFKNQNQGDPQNCFGLNFSEQVLLLHCCDSKLRKLKSKS